ncbi:MAG TPA: helix-turn-helix domain-containing protein [Acidimicrobiales bacterium]|jgi:excisionase family DNA binding protein
MPIYVPDDRLAVSVAEAARIIGVGRTRLYALLDDGTLPARKLDKRTLILRADLEAFLTSLPEYESAS